MAAKKKDGKKPAKKAAKKQTRSARDRSKPKKKAGSAVRRSRPRRESVEEAPPPALDSRQNTSSARPDGDEIIESIENRARTEAGGSSGAGDLHEIVEADQGSPKDEESPSPEASQPV